MEIITQNWYKYFECSALTGSNVNEIINSLLDDIIIRDQLLPEMKKEQKKNNLEYIDLYDCIFEHDVEHMVEVLREM